MRFTIGKKLGLGFGAVLALLGVVGFTSYLLGQSGLKGIDDAEKLVSALNTQSDIAPSVMKLRLAASNFKMNRSVDSIAPFTTTRNESMRILKNAAEALSDWDLDQTLDVVDARLETYAGAVTEFVILSKERHDIFYKDCGPTGQMVEDLLTQLSHLTGDATSTGIAALATDTLAQVNDTRLGVARYLVTSDNAEFGRAERGIGKVRPLLASLVEASAKSPHAETAKKAQDTFEKYVAIGVRVHGIQTRIDTLEASFDLLGNELNASLDTLNTEFDKKMATAFAANRDPLVTKQRLSIASSLTALAVGIAICLLITRSILRPIPALSKGVTSLASGDFTTSIIVKQDDELGDLARSLSSSIEAVRSTIREFSSTASQVAAASTQIAASTEEMAAGLKNQEQQTSQVSEAVDQMALSVSEVVRKGTEAANAAQDSGKDAANGGDVVQNTVTEMKTISEQVNQSAQAVADLGKKSEAIGQIIGVINDIAEQTNLLALNAAIEAARAGEHGRGFAVVADEVRKLAERTTQATEEVSQSIREIQNETNKAVAMINAGTHRVGKGVELASSAGEALKRIVTSSQNVHNMVHSIATAAKGQSAASDLIARSVDAISAVTRSSNQAADQSAQTAAELSSQAEKLKSLVARFKV